MEKYTGNDTCFKRGVSSPEYRKAQGPRELTDREIYNTPIGPVCMSRTEHEAYLEELEWRKLKKKK